MEYIVTDPCYIMTEEAYSERGEREGWENFETTNPFTTDYINKDGHESKMKICIIIGTGGDGSFEHEGQSGGVDSGMLCIAELEDETGWETETYGAKYKTLGEAEQAFFTILAQFYKN